MAGKKYQDVVKLIDPEKAYDPLEAMELVKKTSVVKFDATVEVAFRMGLDQRKNDQQIRGAVVLPHGTGRSVRLVVFAKGDKAREAEAAGADVVGDDDLIARIAGGWLEFDAAIATPDMMASVGRLGRVLGPRGLMPNPKTGTVTFDVKRAVEEVKAGKVEYRLDKGGNVHAVLGKVSFSTEQLLGNFRAIVDALQKAKPAAAKGQYFRNVSVSSTMAPGVQVNLQRLSASSAAE
ncbi:50S ribosomal protein L1 [Ferroacidibacillus organovorans]|uniref:Large ribosomal subunit protein uL1 n=1 Tax=Ferroacidibacillus organovorans TaxID=1765683 RepID=A0A101XPD4_9BACL|nr:50S ribosomal protein L1 [Ferroacidibacillus organovorans]KUO95110.1 50S ribosomal protein L1 [Ferroacidibacillus organovorans]